MYRGSFLKKQGCATEKSCIFLDLWYNKKKYVVSLADTDLGGISMAENKQYITQVQDYGTVMISEDVIMTIVTHAISEIPGVDGLAAKVGSDIADLIGKNWGKGMRIHIAEDNTLTVHCNLNLKYGQSVVDVAKNVQQAIVTAVESTTGVKVNEVNVNICGIGRQ